MVARDDSHVGTVSRAMLRMLCCPAAAGCNSSNYISALPGFATAIFTC